METRELVPGYAVAPQLVPQDMAALADAGFGTVICNRPDSEITPDCRAEAMRRAAEAAGLYFVYNPVVHGQLTAQNIEMQREAIDRTKTAVLAYCASGNRSSVVWALAEADRHDADTLIAAAARCGYQLEPIRAWLVSLHAG